MESSIIGIVLLVFAVVTIILTAFTLVPNPKASKKNMLGFKSVCSLTPVSTVIMLIIGVGFFIIGVSMLR
jgi:hypothetical protein